MTGITSSLINVFFVKQFLPFMVHLLPILYKSHINTPFLPDSFILVMLNLQNVESQARNLQQDPYTLLKYKSSSAILTKIQRYLTSIGIVFKFICISSLSPSILLPYLSSLFKLYFINYLKYILLLLYKIPLMSKGPTFGSQVGIVNIFVEFIVFIEQQNTGIYINSFLSGLPSQAYFYIFVSHFRNRNRFPYI